MDCANETAPKEFILAGLQYSKELKFPLFAFFLIMYLLTLSGNSLILWVVVSNLHLHTPMYWFLCYLSVLDMVVSSVVVPKVIAGFLPGGQVISWGECMLQLFLFHFIGGAECVLYTVMAFDRFLAICKPLHYSNLMNWKACLLLSLGTVIGGCFHSMLETVLTLRLSFGQRNLLDYIFCDIPIVLKLACTDTRLNEMVTLVGIGIVGMTCFLLILTSYVYVFLVIFRMKSIEGRQRAFSTCTAHVTVVGMYYIPLVFHYLRPTSQDSIDTVISVLYTTITPFLNPVIYTLRNKDIKLALMKQWSNRPE